MKLEENAVSKIRIYSIITIIGVVTYFLLLRFGDVRVWISNMLNLLFPFIFGFVIAFLLNKPMLKIEKLLKKVGLKQKGARALSAVLALILGITVVGLFFAILLPQLWGSLVNLVNQLKYLIPQAIASLEELMLAYNIDISATIEAIYSSIDKNVINAITNGITSSIPHVFQFGGQITSAMINILVGMVAGLYLMLDKEQFVFALKSCVYAFFNQEVADYLCRFSRITSDIFNNFIIGKAIDSLIIGILTYICMSIFQMPYALLLSVIVGITNMIPVFGPFIGAIPGVFILTIINPMTGVYFAFLILAIQQFDGNILGPIILGDKLGVPSFAILFSVVFFGGLFGLVGMFIGVPIFTVLFVMMREVVEGRLKKKNIEITLDESNA